MRVLEDNNYIEVTCRHCQSKLAVHAKDITYNEIAHHCSTFEIRCQACGKHMGIPEKSIPAEWINLIAPD